MTLGLSQRCIGNDNQSIVYDDLSKPIVNVAQGEATYEHLGKLNRNVTWRMRNDYLREYLWMRGHVGFRVFYYENLIDDTPEIRALIDGQSYYHDSNEWYDIDIDSRNNKYFLKIWAVVVAIYPIKSPEKNIYRLKWPGDNQTMNENRISPFMQSSSYKYIYLKDSFLEKYEKTDLYYSVPIIDPDGYILCPISYKGEWGIEGLHRIGRNILKISVYDFYKSPKDEILYGYTHAVTPSYANSFNPEEESVVKKIWRFINALWDLGQLFFTFSIKLGCNISSPKDFLEFCAHKNEIEVLECYAIMRKLAWIAPVDMWECDFLSRCNTLHECIQKIKTGFLKNLLLKSGVETTDIQRLGCLKLLEGIKNILDYLVENSENESAWVGASSLCHWKKQNTVSLRQACATF